MTDAEKKTGCESDSTDSIIVSASLEEIERALREVAEKMGLTVIVEVRRKGGKDVRRPEDRL